MTLLAFALLASIQTQSPTLQPARDERVPAMRWTSEVYTIRSERLGEELKLYIGKPPTFERSEQRYPVLLLLDGQYYFDEVLSAVSVLADHAQIPELLLVGIESHDRRVDFTPAEIVLPDVGARARASVYLDFLEHELVPALESSMRAGKPRVLMGHSHSAMFALHAVARRPAFLPWVIAIDAPTHHERGFLARDLLSSMSKEKRPSIRVISQCAVFGWADEQFDSLRSAARPTDLFVHERMRGETHESMVHSAAYRGLQALFADCSMLRARELSPLEIDAMYRALEPAYGVAIAPPEPVMRRVIEDFLLEGRGARAGTWLERYTKIYGKPKDFDALTARIKTVAAEGEPTETVASLLALPRATPEEMRAHLGTWEGTTWRGDGPRAPATVRFRVEDGVVQGAIEHVGEPPIPLAYVRFRADGALEFGSKNGMRPRGLVMWSEKVAGGELEGEVGFRGMRLTLPPGEQWLTQHFVLTRVESSK